VPAEEERRVRFVIRKVAIVAAVVLMLLASAVPAVAAPLPDQRGYELVSPVAKNGVDVRTASSRTHVAADGSALVFSSFAGFGELVGTQVDTEYLAERTSVPGTPGWTTHAVTPRQEPLSFQAASQGATSSFQAAFTPDLSAGVYKSWRPLTDAPNVADVTNLYRLDGLRGGARTVTLLSDAAAPIAAPLIFLMLFRPTLVGASTDLEHVVFESRWQLTTDAPPFSVKLYEFTGGTVRLVGIQPDGTPTASAQATLGSTANDFYPIPHVVSDDGSHIFFTDSTTGDFNASGTLYVRVDGTTTVQLNASEKTAREAAQPATLWGASADGSRAFLITSEGLVDGDDAGDPDLYMWDETAPVGARLTLVSTDMEPEDGESGTKAVVGASDDGHYVYFVADGQLVDDEPSFGNALYLWHDGEISFIGAFGDGNDVLFNGPAAQYVFDNQLIRSRVTPDGRHVLFSSTADTFLRGLGGFDGYDHGGHQELYVYSADSGRLACASCNPTDAPAVDDAVPFVNRGWGAVTWRLTNALSDDGRWVFFNSRDALVSDDTNGRFDAYEYDTVEGTVQLLSGGKDPLDSYFLDASPSGRDVFIATRQRLVGWDVDSSYDVYDVRVNGGFPEPPPVTPGCVGEGCQGQGASQPVAPGTASAIVRGTGDVQRKLKPRHRSKARRCSGRSRSVRAKKRSGRCRRKQARRQNRASGADQRRSK